jgi:hypothetical protein
MIDRRRLPLLHCRSELRETGARRRFTANRSVARGATPIVALAYLDAWEATGDRTFLEYAQAAANALGRGSSAVEVGITSSNSIHRSAKGINIGAIAIAEMTNPVSPLFTTIRRRAPRAF